MVWNSWPKSDLLDISLKVYSIKSHNGSKEGFPMDIAGSIRCKTFILLSRRYRLPETVLYTVTYPGMQGDWITRTSIGYQSRPCIRYGGALLHGYSLHIQASSIHVLQTFKPLLYALNRGHRDLLVFKLNKSATTRKFWWKTFWKTCFVCCTPCVHSNKLRWIVYILYFLFRDHRIVLNFRECVVASGQ